MPIIASVSTTSSAVTSPRKSLLKRKHKRIAYISGPLDWVDAKQRFAGHKRALAEAGVKFDERLLHEGDYHETGGQDALNALFAKEHPVHRGGLRQR